MIAACQGVCFPQGAETSPPNTTAMLSAEGPIVLVSHTPSASNKLTGCPAMTRSICGHHWGVTGIRPKPAIQFAKRQIKPISGSPERSDPSESAYNSSEYKDEASLADLLDSRIFDTRSRLRRSRKQVEVR